MKRATPIVLALAVLLIAILGVQRAVDDAEVVLEERPSEASDEGELVAPPAPQELEAPTPADTGREQIAAESAPVMPGASEGMATLDVIARWDDDGTPAASMGVSTFPSGRPNPFLHRDRTVTGPDGRATFVVRAPERLGAYLDQGGAEYVDLAPGDARELVLEAERWAVARGRVVDREGNPQADAEIWVSAAGNYTDGSVVARTRGDGRFEVPVGASNYIGALKVGHVPSHLRSPRPAKGEELELVLPLRGPSGRIVGVVRDAAGAPVAGALVHVGTLRGHVVELEDGGRGNQAPGLEAHSDDEGRFVVESVEPGRATLRARAPGYALALLGIDIGPDRESEVDVVLTRGITARGTVREPDGSPVEGATVAYGEYGEFDSGRVTTAADGTYELPGGTPMGWTLVARKRGTGKALTRLSGAPGDTVEWNPVLDPGRVILGVVRDSAGVPLEDMMVNARTSRYGGGARLQAVTAADGSFLLSNGKDDVYSLAIAERGTAFAIHQQGGVRPSPDPLTIVIPAEARGKAYVKGRLVLPEGVRATLIVHPVDGDSGPRISFDAETGAFADGPWPPGEYRLWIDSDDYPRATLATFPLAAGETRDLGTLALPPTGKLVVATVLADGAPAKGVTLEVHDRHGARVHRARLEVDAEAEVEVAPGSYVVRASAGSELAAHTVAEVTSGATVRVELDLASEPRLEVALAFEGEELGSLALTVFDAAGWPVGSVRRVDVKADRTFGLPLPAGSYRLQAVAGDGRRGSASVQVAAGSSPTRVAVGLR